MKANPLIFNALLREHTLPTPHAEYRFHPTRKWRFDYAWVNSKVALEVEGAVWTGGRHTRGAGFLKDIEKYNNATALGWRILRCTPSTLTKSETIVMLILTLEVAGK